MSIVNIYTEITCWLSMNYDKYINSDDHELRQNDLIYDCQVVHGIDRLEDKGFIKSMVNEIYNGRYRYKNPKQIRIENEKKLDYRAKTGIENSFIHRKPIMNNDWYRE